MVYSTIQVSNRIECLLDKLCCHLENEPGDAFSQRLVVVSSQTVRQWLSIRLAEKRYLGILAGIEVTFLEGAIKQIQRKRGVEIGYVPNAMELALRLEGEIEDVHREWCSGGLCDTGIWDPLWKMLKLEGRGGWDPRSHKRLVHLTEHLARLFAQYAMFGGTWLQQWEGDWQRALWDRVFQEGSGWSTIGHQIRKSLTSFKKPRLTNLQIHLFGLSCLSALEAAFFRELVDEVPCHFYVVSPCQLFWADIVSDREKRYLHEFWEKTEAPEAQIRELERFLRDRNPLLANFGRLGREFHSLLEESKIFPETYYQIPQSVSDHPIYHERLLPDCEILAGRRHLTLLEAVQADLLLLRNPETENKVEFPQYDGSVQLHTATSPWREVEILHDRLLSLIYERQASEAPLKCEDILVMAPDIMEYAPYIRTVFDKKHSPLPFQIMDVSLEAQSPYFRGMTSLFELGFGRWDIVSLLELLEHPYLLHRFGFTSEEGTILRDWILEAGIKWGDSKVHRDEILAREGCKRPLLETSDTATWSEGLKRLLLGLAIRVNTDSEEILRYNRLPVEGIDGTQGELLGKLVKLVTSLRQELRPFADGTRHTLREWMGHLRRLLEAYFSVPSDDTGGTRDQQQVWIRLAELEQGPSPIDEMTFPFETIWQHLKGIWKEQKGVLHENHTGVVRFCSLLPMRSIPARVVWLMGMDEATFPRKETERSLNLLNKASETDYCPSRGDYDRYLFLEAILSARDVLGISYQGYSWEDYREVPPSLVVSELADYLKRAFSFAGKEFGEGKGWFKHPFSATHPAGFTGEGGPFASFSSWAYRVAKACVENEGSRKRHFFPSLHQPATRGHEEGTFVVDLHDLSQMAANPVKAFLNKTMGMYLRRDQRLDPDESLALDALSQYRIRRFLLSLSADSAYHVEEGQGRLPWGVFKEIARTELKEEAVKVETFLGVHQIQKDSLFAIQFARNFQGPTSLGSQLMGLPSLRLKLDQSREVFLEGTLSNVSPQGLLALGKSNNADLWKIWPLYLVFCLAVERFNLPWGRNLFLLRTGVTHSEKIPEVEEKIKEILRLYFDSGQTVSPLLPEWIDEWAKNDTDKLMERIKQDLHPRSAYFYNDYARWAWDLDDLPWSEEAVSHWQARVKKIWDPMQESLPIKG